MAAKTQVQYLVQGLIQSLHEREAERQGVGKGQVNTRISLYSIFMLERLANHLDESRSGLAAALLEAAIHDACNEAGLPDLAELYPDFEQWREGQKE